MCTYSHEREWKIDRSNERKYQGEAELPKIHLSFDLLIISCKVEPQNHDVVAALGLDIEGKGGSSTKITQCFLDYFFSFGERFHQSQPQRT